MKKVTIESILVSLASPEDRYKFIVSTFSEKSLHEMFRKHLPAEDDIGEMWQSSLEKLIASIVSIFVYERDHKMLDKVHPMLDHFRDIAQMEERASKKGLPAPIKKTLNLYLDGLPSGTAKKKNDRDKEKYHSHLITLLAGMIDSIHNKLKNTTAGAEQPSSRQGDVILDGTGFEIVVGAGDQHIVRYPDKQMAIVLIHDPRDGHFLLVERYCRISGGFVLEMPKVAPDFSANKKLNAEVTLRDDMGLSLRDLEKIGEIHPDTHVIDGVCEVFYTNFDLEEHYQALALDIRAIKRVNEEGIYQAAYDGRLTCAMTLSAVSIWRAFESVRKKRVANSKRIRTPKVVGDEDDDTL